MHYLIGDLHGHFSPLESILSQIHFDPKKDTLFFLGDLINGGHQNLEIIRFIQSLGSAANTVLGNHDLTAIAVFFGQRKYSKNATYEDLLQAPDATELFEWYRHQPLAIHLKGQALLTHAGIDTPWDAQTTLNYAQRIQNRLQQPDPRPFLRAMFQPVPNLWEQCTSPLQQDVYCTNVMTRQRARHPNGALDFDFKSTLEEMPSDLLPWFQLRAQTPKAPPVEPIFFGHWSALGYHPTPIAICLDSGLRWQGPLTCYCLENKKIFQAQKS